MYPCSNPDQRRSSSSSNTSSTNISQTIKEEPQSHHESLSDKDMYPGSIHQGHNQMVY